MSTDLASAPSGNALLSWLFLGGKIVGGLLLTLTLVLYYNQDKMLYIPNTPGMPRTPDENPPGMQSPNDWNREGRLRRGVGVGIPFEDVMIKTKDNISIHVWLLLQDDAENCPTIIYFHGNAGNMGFRLKNAASMYAVAKVNILMVDYRGYGKSEGQPSEIGLQLDAEAALDFAQNHSRLKDSAMIMFGRSLGGAVSVYLAHKFPERVRGVIVENTFLSVSAMVDKLMPFLKSIKSIVLNIKWNSDDKVGSLKQPILFISGDKDELVPRFHMEKLHELAKSSVHAEFYSVTGGTHNDTWERGGAAYYKRLQAFADRFRRATSKSVEATTEQAPEVESTKEPEVRFDEDDFYMVNAESIHIPTMTTNFSVQ